MTDELEDRIGSLLTRKAGRMDGVPGGELLAGNAERRGRQIRTRRQLLTGIAGAAALAVAVPVGYQTFGGRDQRLLPADPSPTVTPPPPPDKPMTVAIDIAKLPKGPPPVVPWFSGGTLHNGDRVTRTQGVYGFQQTAGGYVILVPIANSHDSRLLLINPAGETIRELPGYVWPLPSAVSADGSRIAGPVDVSGRAGHWSQAGDLVLVDGTTGETLAKRPVRSRSIPSVAGFVGNRVVFGLDDRDRFQLWDPETDKLTSFRGGLPASTDGHDRVVFAVMTKDYRARAYGATSTRTGRQLWLTEELSKDVMSAPDATMDGRYVAGSSRRRDTVVLDAATGRVVLRATGHILSNYCVESEPSGDLLFWATDGKEAPGALVRCSLYGDREIAAELTELNDQPLAYRRSL